MVTFDHKCLFMKLKTLLFLLFSIVVGDAGAQRMNVRFKRLSTEEGISHASVLAIAQDHRGFMWFGTEDGLNKYDGNKFTVYRHEATDYLSIGNNYIQAILEDSEKKLWVSTWGGGLNLLDPTTETFTHFRHDAGKATSLGHDIILELFTDQKDNLWVGIENGGLNLFQPETATFTRYQTTPVTRWPYLDWYRRWRAQLF